MNTLTRSLLPAAVAATLAACGGGGGYGDGGNNNPPPPPPVTLADGQFVLERIEGLGVRGNGATDGATDATGNFKFGVGQDVRALRRPRREQADRSAPSRRLPSTTASRRIGLQDLKEVQNDSDQVPRQHPRAAACRSTRTGDADQRRQDRCSDQHCQSPRRSRRQDRQLQPGRRRVRGRPGHRSAVHGAESHARRREDRAARLLDAVPAEPLELDRAHERQHARRRRQPPEELGLRHPRARAERRGREGAARGDHGRQGAALRRDQPRRQARAM